jgi:hypothetical protein
MSTSSDCSSRTTLPGGFTALELVIGLALTAILTVCVAPFVISLQKAGVSVADRTVSVTQGRVAAARLEMDLRMASSGDSRFAVEGPVLEATAKQLVLLGRAGAGSGPCVIEWEIAGSSLMRRWGPCPEYLPAVFAHSLYSDHKSMLEGLSSNSHFSYEVAGALVSGTVTKRELAWVQAVVLATDGRDSAGEWRSQLRTRGRVGR